MQPVSRSQVEHHHKPLVEEEGVARTVIALDRLPQPRAVGAIDEGAPPGQFLPLPDEGYVVVRRVGQA